MKTGWSIGPLEQKTFYLPSGQVTKNGKEKLFPVTICRLELIYSCLDGTKESWFVCYNRGRFSIHYPDTKESIDKWGFFRPSGDRVIHNRDTGLSAETLMQRLYQKFDRAFVKKIVLALN